MKQGTLLRLAIILLLIALMTGAIGGKHPVNPSWPPAPSATQTCNPNGYSANPC